MFVITVFFTEYEFLSCCFDVVSGLTLFYKFKFILLLLIIFYLKLGKPNKKYE